MGLTWVVESGCFLMDQGFLKKVELVIDFTGSESIKQSDSIVTATPSLHWGISAVEYQTVMEQ